MNFFCVVIINKLIRKLIKELIEKLIALLYAYCTKDLRESKVASHGVKGGKLWNQR